MFNPISNIYQKLLALFFLCLMGLSQALYAGETVQKTLLTNATVIDATGKAPIENATVVIEGNKIAAITQGGYKNTDSNSRVIDLEGAYIVPGLWNNHSHLADLLPDPKNTLENEPVLRATIRAGRNAMDALKGGFTSLRMVGERDFIDVAWKQAFEAGVFVGPRIVPSGAPISSGGDGDWLVAGGKGPDAIRDLVNKNIDNGAEVIKIMADRMEEKEIKAAIEAAHKRGVKVTGHASDDTTRIGIKYGIDGIEHGYGLSDDTIQLMAENNVFYDPTIVCNLSEAYINEREQLIEKAGYHSSKDVVEGRIVVAYADERSQEMAENQREILKKAQAAGVKIISGSDSNPIDEVGILEIEQLVFSGLTEMQAIQAATINSAEMVGMEDKLGTIEVGKLADLIVLQKNPLDNISNLRSLSMVFKDGKLVNRAVDEGQTSFWKLYFLD